MLVELAPMLRWCLMKSMQCLCESDVRELCIKCESDAIPPKNFKLHIDSTSEEITRATNMSC